MTEESFTFEIFGDDVEAAAIEGAAISKRFNHLENKKFQKTGSLSISSCKKKGKKGKKIRLLRSCLKIRFKI
jgi:hypothetical protein